MRSFHIAPTIIFGRDKVFGRRAIWLRGCLIALAFALAGTACAQEREALTSLDRETVLFNGQDLSGWLFFTDDDQINVSDVWSVAEGVLKCKGRPAGYLQTKRWYKDYELELEWRWPGESGGNSGVLVHTSTPLLFYGWPKSLEVQLQAGAAGDFWVIGTGVDLRVKNEAERRPQPVAGDQHSHRRVKRLSSDEAKSCENPIGQWNKMKIICDGDRIRVLVNGKLVNEGSNCTVNQGAIALQAEGTPIEFKSVVIRPLERNKKAAEQ